MLEVGCQRRHDAKMAERSVMKMKARAVPGGRSHWRRAACDADADAGLKQAGQEASREGARGQSHDAGSRGSSSCCGRGERSVTRWCSCGRAGRHRGSLPPTAP